MNSSERRRVTFAAVLTLVALPALWVLNREQAATRSAPSAGAAGVETPIVNGHDGTAAPYQPEVPAFIDGTPSPAAAQPVRIVTGTPPPGNRVKGKATYHRYVDGSANSCTTAAAPAGTILTVTNLNNGQSVQCTNNYGWTVPAGMLLVLDTGLFGLIGDLADAPAPIAISW